MVKNVKYLAAISIIAVSLVAIVTIATLTDTLTIKTQKVIPDVDARGEVDAMQVIEKQILEGFANGAAPDVQQENIRQAEGLIFGKPVIFATNGIPQTQEISLEYDNMAERFVQGLDTCADKTCQNPAVAAQAKELKDRIVYWQEIKQTLEKKTMAPECDPKNPETCPLLNQNDEPGMNQKGLTVGTDKIWDGWYREIRSPYAIHAPYQTPQENIMTTESIGKGECSVVVKEIQGVKSILRPTYIPIWQEPWYSRAQIIGYDIVWVVDFVPAEFVKSLKYCNNNGSIDFDYEIDVIIERELLHFWKFLPAGNP